MGNSILWLFANAIGLIATVAVTRYKVSAIEEKISKMNENKALNERELFTRVRTLEADSTRCDESRNTLRIAIDRLDERKASKEMMDSIRSDVHNLSALVDNRFTKIEELINKVFYDKKN
jgi:hypothetical protein